MGVFESLENLNVSEECFNEIIRIVEEILNESPTISSTKLAAAQSLPLRMNQYRQIKANSNSNPQDIKRASDRVDRAAQVKKAGLRKSDFKKRVDPKNTFTIDDGERYLELGKFSHNFENGRKAAQQTIPSYEYQNRYYH